MASKIVDLEKAANDAHAETMAALKAAQKRPASVTAQDRKSKFARTLVEEYELLPEDEQGDQKWRGDPSLTFSDWTIEITSEGPVPVSSEAVATATPGGAGGDAAAASMISPSPMAGVTAPDSPDTPAAKTGGETVEIRSKTDTYHVHRYFLAFGSRRSEYFAKLFQESKGGVSRSSKTKLELEPLAAKAFPDLLDFLYDPRAPLVISPETAVALHSLGLKFEMTHLQHYSMQFVQKDLSMDSLEMYYEHAKMFDDEPVMDFLVQFIGENIGAIASDSNFVKNKTDIQLWKKALEFVTPTSVQTDLHLSKLIAEFGSANPNKIDAETFHELTSETKLRKVDADVALTLCGLEDKVSPSKGDELSSLQARCSTALAESWKDLDAHEEGIKERTQIFLVDLLGKCLDQARKENEKLTGKTRAGKSRASRARADRVGSHL